MRASFRQCLAWLVLTLTLICTRSSRATEISTHTGADDLGTYLETPSTSKGKRPAKKPPEPRQAEPPAGKSASKVQFEPPSGSDVEETGEESGPKHPQRKLKYRSPVKGMFNYLFGLDYPYHQFEPPKEEEPLEVPETVYSDFKDDLDTLDFSDMDDEKLNKLLYDVLLDYHPGHFTRYNAEWGHTILTKDRQIPLGGDAIHFDIFDGYLPRGVKFNDLRVLFLYTIEDNYYLYKVKFGDMVVTLRPDLENVTVHLFESYGGLMIIRILFFIAGMFEKHEYIETGRRTRLFKKMSGRSITPPMPKFPEGQEVTEEMIRDWMRERYTDIAKTNPAIVEELINYKVVFTR